MSVTRNTLYNQMLDMTGTRRRHDDNEREEAEMLREFLFEEPLVSIVLKRGQAKLIKIVDVDVSPWRTPIMYKRVPP